MNDIPPGPPRLVRKTAYGRTELFLPTTSTIIREVKCMGGIQRYDSASVYHMLPTTHEQDNVSCWHCCEPITDKRKLIPLPRMYDTSENIYHVYGATCSPCCAKAYVLEHTSFDRGQHLNVLVKMLRELYSVTDPIVTAPPRAAMQRFGGQFDATLLPKADCTLVQPPFVSYCMLVEEKMTGANTVNPLPPAPQSVEAMNVEEADTLEEPHPPGMYDEYLRRQEERTSDHEQSATSKQKRKRDSGSSSGVSGPLSKFVRPS